MLFFPLLQRLPHQEDGSYITSSFDTQNAQSYDSDRHSASYNFESGVHAITIRR
ncbi:MAG: hypothetical protein IKP81_01530 [Paludibacteraceae bacterium]|nr:hypothetical protein [Paludibacteraceae bacterium]